MIYRNNYELNSSLDIAADEINNAFSPMIIYMISIFIYLVLTLMIPYIVNMFENAIPQSDLKEPYNIKIKEPIEVKWVEIK